jgi:hypothetical protein
VYSPENLSQSECCDSLASNDGFAKLAASGGRLVSAFVRATKPLEVCKSTRVGT